MGHCIATKSPFRIIIVVHNAYMIKKKKSTNIIILVTKGVGRIQLYLPLIISRCLFSSNFPKTVVATVLFIKVNEGHYYDGLSPSYCQFSPSYPDV